MNIKIDVIHDVVCSWCPIGIRNIRAALIVLDKQCEVEIKYLPFELNPEMPPEGETIEAHFMRRNDWTQEQYLHYREGLIETARDAGLVYDVSKRTHYYHTAKAHRLIHFAQAFQKQSTVADMLTARYFTQGVNVSKDEHLLDIAASVGLNRRQAESALTSAAVFEAIQQKYDRVKQIAMEGVPAFSINDTQFVKGSNSVAFFVHYFEQLVQVSQ